MFSSVVDLFKFFTHFFSFSSHRIERLPRTNKQDECDDDGDDGEERGGDFKMKHMYEYWSIIYNSDREMGTRMRRKWRRITEILFVR